MKHLSVALIFWLAIWTAPRCDASWEARGVILAWGFYLCRKILNEEES